MAKGSLDTALSSLGQFAPNLSRNVQQIAVNKAAAASLPMVKSGISGQAAAVGGLVGSTFNPTALAIPAAMSPRLNFEVAKRAGSALKGLNFLQTLDPNSKIQLFQNPEMLSKFMLTVVNTPQIKDQVKEQMLGSALGGGQNAQR